MTEQTMPFNDLVDKVIDQLKNQGYMNSTLTVYRRTYNRVHKFINARGTDIYTCDAGAEFLRNTHVCRSTITAYTCAIRRLDDYIKGNPYRCHHGNPIDEVAEIYSSTLEAFLNECKAYGNKPATLQIKKRACIAFLNYLVQIGCSELSELDSGIVSKALLIFSNKDNYAIIRQFLKYLDDNSITTSDFSRIVPKYKRRKVLPTTYTTDEIKKVEAAVNTDTDSGKRNLAIIRLATRIGLRSGDIAKLKSSEIDFNSGYISIIQEKTGMPLSLQMPQDVSNALLQHLENLKRIPEDGYVFHSLCAPYGRITTSIIRHTVADSFIIAGVDTNGKKHGPHAFRSSLASSMVNDCGSYETIRKILGHSDPDVIKHYAKTDVEKLRLCSIDPPVPSGLFRDYLSGKKVIGRV